MAEGLNLENMYFDVLLRDRTAEGVRDIENSIKDKLKVELDVGNSEKMVNMFASLTVQLDKIKTTIEEINGKMRQAGDGGGGGGMEAVIGSYRRLQQELAKAKEEWKDMPPGLERSGFGNKIQGLATDIKNLDDGIKPLAATAGSVANLRKELEALGGSLDGIDSTSSNAQQAAMLKERIALQTQLLRLRERASQLGLSTTDADGNQLSVAALQQRISLHNQLAAAKEREQQMNKSDSELNQLEQTKQRIAAIREGVAQTEAYNKALAAGVDFTEKGLDFTMLTSKQMEKMADLQQKINSARTETGYDNEIRKMQQELDLYNQLNDAKARINALRDPNSQERKNLGYQQEAQLLNQIFNKQAEIAALQSKWGTNTAGTSTLADKQAQLNVNKQLIQAEGELKALQSAKGQQLQAVQAELTANKQLNNLKAQAIVLQRQLDALKSGNDITNTALKQEVSLQQQLVALEAKRKWLEAPNAAGGTNADALKRAQQAVRDLLRDEERLGAVRRKGTDELRRHGSLLQSLKNMAANYIGAFGVVSFVKSLYRITGEYERQTVALRALMQSASQAAIAVGELQQMALHSPFSFAQLTDYAKRLSAYQVANHELLDTTKKLADLSAGLGVDMGRIILAYGHVQSASYLSGYVLRQFTMAGVPMVQALADQFTKLEGRVVSVAEVFQRISQKQVSFENVKAVLDDMTDVGGRFYNHQEKIVETIYGKLNRLKDAYTIMMSKFGDSNNKLLAWPLNVITSAMQNWRSSISFIISAAVFAGMFRLGNAIRNFGNAADYAKYRIALLGEAIKKNLFGALVGFGSALVVYGIQKLWDLYQEAKEVENAIVKLGKDTHEELSRYLKDHKEVHAKIKVKDISIDGKELSDAWGELQQKLLDMGERERLSKLLGIEDLRERTKEAIELIESIDKASAALEKHKIDIDMFGPTSKYGIIDRLKRYSNEVEKGTYGGIYYEKFINDTGNKLASRLKESYRAAVKAADIDENSEEQGRAFVRLWIKGFESEYPEMTDNMRVLFEREMMDLASDAGINIGQTITFHAGEELRYLGDISETSIKEVFRQLNKVAKDSGEDLQNILSDFYSKNEERAKRARDLLVKMSVDALAAAEDNVPAIRAMYHTLYLDIDALARLMSTIEPEMPNSALQDLHDSIFKGYNTAMSRQVGELRPKAGETTKDYSKRMYDTEEEKKDSARRNRAAAQAAKDAKTRAAFLKEAEEAEGIAKEARDRINMMHLLDTKKNRGGSKTGKGSKKDPWLEEIKARIKEYEDAEKEVERLVKAGMNYDDAVEKVLKLTWTYVNNEDWLGDGGLKAFANYYLGDVKKRLRAAPADKKSSYQEVVRKLEGLINDQDVKELTRSMEILDEELKRLVEATTREWELYDKVLVATGDKGLAAMSAFKIHKPVFKNLQDNLEAELKNSMGDRFTDMDDLLNKNTTALKNVIGMTSEEIALLNKIRDLRNSTYLEVIDKSVSALQEQMTIEEKIAAQRVETAQLLDKYLRAGGKEGDTHYKALVAQGEEAIRKIKTEGLEKTQLWDAIFGNMNGRGFKQIEKGIKLANELAKSAKVIKKNPEGLPEYYEATYEDADGALQKITLTVEQLEKLQELENLFSEARSRNAFRSLAVAFKELMKNPKTAQWQAFAEELSNVSDIASDLASKFSEMSEAAGNKGLAQAFGDLADSFSSLSNIAQGFTQGGVVGGIVAGLGEGMSWVAKLFKRHDEQLQDLIDKLSIYQSRIDKTQESLKDMFENALGGIYTADPFAKAYDLEGLRRRFEAYNNEFMAKYRELLNGPNQQNVVTADRIWDAYSQQWINIKEFAEKYGEANAAVVKALHSNDAWDIMYASLFVERENLRKQYEAELDKKNSDDSALEDYRQKISDLDKEIQDFAKDMAKALYDIDVKSWAKDLTDAIVDAWAKGEDAVKAFRDKATDIIKSLAKTIIAQKFMEVALQPVLDMIEQTMFEKKGKLDEDDIVAIANGLEENGLSAVNIITQVLDKLKERGVDLTDTSDGNTLGKGIQSITEDTANLLASYVNAIRADVSVIRILNEQQTAQISEIALAQVAQLNIIAANTLRNAEAAERIENALSSVIQVGADGAMLRV